MVDLAPLMIAPDRFWGGEALGEHPCLFVSASDSGKFLQQPMLPPCPVVMIGEGSDADSHWCDAVVSNEAEARRVLAQVAANPRAAGVMVELLRILPSLSLDDGLVAESLAYGVLQGSDEFSRWLDLRGPAAALPSGRVMLERAGPILRITLDRPQADNAIDAPMRDELASALELALLDSTIERVELRGAGRSFSLGADLAEFGTTRDPARAHAIRRQTLPARLAARLGERLEAHVQGACVGAGLELAAYAGRITAGPRAWFQLPELAMGLLPGAGGCVSLVRRIGRQKTALLYLSGKRISALTAFEWGLVDEITGDDDGSDESGI